MTDSETLQREHFDHITQRYEAHYFDPTSRRYRSRFFHKEMIRGLSLTGASVLEAMCGTGSMTDDLIRRGARVTGLEISPTQAEEFRRRHPECAIHCGSILSTGLPGEQFDAVFVIGGLHHLHPHLDQGILEIHRLLKPGGMFCFTEPPAGSLPDQIRRLWYSRDRLFGENEESIHLETLQTTHRTRFDFLRTHFGGGPAYHFVLNSMIWRVPLSFKPYYAPPLIGLEMLLSRVPMPRFISSFVVCQWRKK